ncbi:hypothetical protein NST33_18100 [Paenibacillus sp. FSL L8-0435]|uniref:hypothetical protein n=1 Tax=Paenibacillus sp. FSL L8-0435 TaxID=2954618 RepID=UPI0030DA99D4
MRFYAIANKECIDCFYDFELSTWGDGLCSHNLLPAEDFAVSMLLGYELDEDGIVVEVFIDKVTEGNDGQVDYSYDDIWYENRS